MAGALKKSMMWLGLSAEDEYAEESYEQEAGRRAAGHSEPGDSERSASAPRSAEVTPIKRERSVPTLVREHPATTTGEIARIATIHPRSYNDAKAIGESFRSGVPVIMNLTDMGESDAKRLVDFSAGLVFGLHGSIERVTSKVFLLSPKNVEVTEEGGGSPTSTATGFFNQS